MAKFSEDSFDSWRKPPSDSEESKLEAARKSVRKSITDNAALNKLDLEIFGQGSYANDTNVRLNSDVDINVMYKEEFYFDLPEGKTMADFGINSSDKISLPNYKNLIEQALVDEFGRENVKRLNKCFKILESPTRVACDVVPTFVHRRYAVNGTFIEGIELLTESNIRVRGYPKQHTQNAILKNSRTGRSFKRATRILKRLRYKMKEDSVAFPESITSFLLECLMWNVPDNIFNESTRWSDIIRNSLYYIWEKTKDSKLCEDWGEVSELLYLFKGGRKWTVKDVNEFIVALWNYLEFPTTA